MRAVCCRRSRHAPDPQDRALDVRSGETEVIDCADVLVAKVCSEHRRVIRVEAERESGFVHATNRMIERGQVAVLRREGRGRRAAREQHVGVAATLKRGRVSTTLVVDAIDPEHVQRCLDETGRAGFACVGREAQTRFTGAQVNRRKRFRRERPRSNRG